MAHRDALRGFQPRPAGPVQAARSSGPAPAASWLAVEAGSAHCLIPLGHAGEIFPWAPPQALPYTASWFLGVANLRGGLFGVVDLAAFLGAPRASPAAAGAVPDRSRLIAFNERLEVHCALRVDRLIGLRGVDAFTAATRPDADAPPWLGHAYLDAQGSPWQEINLQALSQQPRFLNIGTEGDSPRSGHP